MALCYRNVRPNAPRDFVLSAVLICQAEGLDEPQARVLASRLMASKDTALDTLVREELGVDPQEFGGSPWAAAGSSFGPFAFGAIFPVAPFFIQEVTSPLEHLVRATRPTKDS